MSTEIDRLLDVQFGLHSSAADFSSVPGSLTRILLHGGGNTLDPRARTNLDRNELMALNGQGFAHMWGPKDLSNISPVMEFKGLGGSFASEQGGMLTSMFGVGPLTSAAELESVTSGSNAATGVLVVDGTTIANGDFVLFQTDTGVFARQVVSGGGTTTLTLDRPFTGTVSDDATVIMGARWVENKALRNPLHGFFRAERPQGRMDFFGCAPVDMTLDFTEGAKTMMTSNWRPTDWTPDDALSPSVTYPSVGQPIVNLGTRLYIGTEEFLVRGASFALATGNQDRASSSSPNGILGGVSAERRAEGAVLTGRLYFGANSPAIKEVARTTGVVNLSTLLGYNHGGLIATTRDVLFEIPSNSQRAMALRIPTAAITAQMTTEGQLKMIDFTARSTLSSELVLF